MQPGLELNRNGTGGIKCGGIFFSLTMEAIEIELKIPGKVPLVQFIFMHFFLGIGTCMSFLNICLAKQARTFLCYIFGT